MTLANKVGVRVEAGNTDEESETHRGEIKEKAAGCLPIPALVPFSLRKWCAQRSPGHHSAWDSSCLEERHPKKDGSLVNLNA